MTEHYLSLEIDGIKGYVFNPPRLRDIRGGSALLDHFNRVTMVDEVKKATGDTLFTGGGHALAILPSRPLAEATGRTLTAILQQRTGGQAGLTWGVAAKDQPFSEARKAFGRDRLRTSSQAQVTGPPLPPFVALCQACGVGPAIRPDSSVVDRVFLLCSACVERGKQTKRLRQAADNTLWSRLSRHATTMSPDAVHAAIPEGELEDLVAQMDGARNYLAYLYCDGNAMGRRLHGLESVDDYQSFAARVDHALHAATMRALERHCRPGKGSSGKEGDRFGADVLLLGGDDLILVTRADRALEVARTILTVFKQLSGFTLSAGLVFARYNTPITILQRMAEALLDSAKRRAYLEEDTVLGGDSDGPRAAVGYLDFQELTSAETSLKREQDITCRPYRLDELDILEARGRALKRSQVPSGRLYAIDEALRGSYREAMNTTRLVVGRTHEAIQSELRMALCPPWLLEKPARQPAYWTRDQWPKLEHDTWPWDLYSDQHRWSPLPELLELLPHLSAESSVDGSSAQNCTRVEAVDAAPQVSDTEQEETRP